MADPLWWFGFAACNDNRSGFVTLGNQHEVARCRAICGTCPVEQVCLWYGVSLEYSHHRHGMFGGLTPREREALEVDQDTAHLYYEAEREHSLRDLVMRTERS